MSGSPASGQTAGMIRGFDHVAVPMQNTDAMLAFYRGLGLQMNETPTAGSASVHVLHEGYVRDDPAGDRVGSSVTLILDAGRVIVAGGTVRRSVLSPGGSGGSDRR